MENNYRSCNFLYSDVIDASVPYNPMHIRITKPLLNLKYSKYTLLPYILHPKKILKGLIPSHSTENFSPSLENENLNLQAGEWVQVRSIEEISVTLDEKGKYKGLYFMPEMEKFCGKNYKVFKKVEIIKLESTGEVRKLRSPTVFLEGVYCNGERHEGCDRSCFHFWREVWLKRISE